MKYETIMMATDFSRNAQLAFEKAYDLARQLCARLVVLYVQDESTFRMAVKEGLLREDSTNEELQAEVEGLTQMHFSTFFAGYSFTDVEVERLVRRGDPDAVIVECAKTLNADLIVIGMRGAGMLGTIKSILLGSVAESLIHKTPCPLMLVKLEHT